MACKYVKEFEFGGAAKAKGKAYAEGGSVKADLKQDKKMVAEAVHKHERNMHPKEPLTPMKKGGKVMRKAMEKREVMQTPSMRKEEMTQKRMVKGPAMAAGRDPRMPMIAVPAMKCGGKVSKK